MLGSMVTVLCLSLAMVFVVEGYQNAYDKPLSVTCPNGRGIDRIKVSLRSLNYKNINYFGTNSVAGHSFCIVKFKQFCRTYLCFTLLKIICQYQIMKF